MHEPSQNPLADFIARQGVMVLDGGLATALEARGYDLNDPLWSAKILVEAPHAIREVHTEFLAAGADCITASTYQASFAGFQSRGLSESESEKLLRRSVELALEARDSFWSKPENRTGRLRPLVAASIGPYGASLADGSEYTGDYSIDDAGLMEFHRRRWTVLAAEADLLACETIPSRRESQLLRQLLGETPSVWAWFSFSCRDDEHISDGTPLADVVRECASEPQIAAVGINCTAPQFISSLLTAARGATSKPLIAYPNSGEQFRPEDKTWGSPMVPVDWTAAPCHWHQLGASCLGGCCRVGIGEVAQLRRAVLDNGRSQRESPWGSQRG